MQPTLRTSHACLSRTYRARAAALRRVAAGNGAGNPKSDTRVRVRLSRGTERGRTGVVDRVSRCRRACVSESVGLSAAQRCRRCRRAVIGMQTPDCVCTVDGRTASTCCDARAVSETAPVVVVAAVSSLGRAARVSAAAGCAAGATCAYWDCSAPRVRDNLLGLTLSAFRAASLASSSCACCCSRCNSSRASNCDDTSGITGTGTELRRSVCARSSSLSTYSHTRQY